jgi:hypothetical protein
VVLVDTSVWGRHFRSGDAHLEELLLAGEVLVHPAVIGELALSNLRRRTTTIALLQRLPRAQSATDDEVMAFVGNLSLHGRGIGWVDAHLIASARLTNCVLWSADRPLIAAALHAHVRVHPAA